MASPKIFLCGYYGFGNTGDAMILKGIAGALGKVFPRVELTVTSGGGALEVPARPVHWQDVEAIRAAVAAAELVVVGGGGLFQDYWGVDRTTLGTARHHGVTFYAWPLLLAAELHVPSLLWGVGVGPLSTQGGRSLARAAVEAASWVSVRDHASAALLAELGVPEERVAVVPDAAWAAPQRCVDRGAVLAEMGLPASAKLVAVALRRWPENEVSIKRELAEALRRVAGSHRLGIAFVPFHCGTGRDDDEAAARQVAAALDGGIPRWVVPPSWGAAARFWLCAAADGVVGMRLHACLAAFRGGTTPVGVAYDPKVAALFAEMGAEERVREPACWDAEALAAAVSAELGEPARVREAALQRVRRSHVPALTAKELVSSGKGRHNGVARRAGRNGMEELSRGALMRRCEEIVRTHRGVPEVVLFLPSVYWRTEVFQRPNQLALALARAGCLVFFWEPPTSARFGPGFHRVARRLYVANVPREVWAALEDPLVVALPYNRQWLQGLGCYRLVYDVIDHLDVFLGGRAALADTHAALLEEATVVTVVSKSLLDEVRQRRDDAVYLPNAADPQAIARVLAAPPGPAAPPAPPTDGFEVGYFGSFANWLDYDLFTAVLCGVPDASLRLIGPDLDGSLAESGILDEARVRYLGARPYEELHEAFQSVRVALIPFRHGPVSTAVSPLKLYEYVAMGLPVVSSDLPECRDVPGVWVARTAGEFVAAVRQAAEGVPPDVRRARESFVAANTWQERAHAWLAAVRAAPHRAVPPAHVQQIARQLAQAAQQLEEERQAAAQRQEQLRRTENELRQTEAQARSLQQQCHAVEQKVAAAEAEAQRWARQYQELVEQYGQRQREVGAAEAEAQRWARQYQELVEQYGQRQREVERLSASLESVVKTRWFALASRYWRLREMLRGARRAPQVSRAIEEMGGAAPVESRSPAPALAVAPAAAPAPAEQPAAARHDYLFLPIIDWDFRFQRPQQLATALAGRGHRVYFGRTTFRRRGAAVEVAAKTGGVWEVSLRGSDRSVYRDALTPVEVEELADGLGVLRRQQCLGATAVVVELPFWWPVASELRRRWGCPVIYDCMDYHPGFSTNDAAMLALEEELIRGADLVVVSSQFLEQQVAGVARRRVRIPNACDFDHFAGIPWRRPTAPPTVGYYGAIADWFDAPLVAELARLRPEWRFLLVGSTYTCDTTPLLGCRNVTLAGEQPYAELPDWIERMDVLLIPFRRTPLTEATNPVKFYEIMAAGKPLVSVPLPELAAHADLVAFAESAQQFAARIEELLGAESERAAQSRRDFARGHTWAARADALEGEVQRSFPLASVVVVTFNNLPLTQACLASVLERTEWPAFEVIVVDNGSTDGTPAYLRGLAEADERVRVILNPDNRGFAAANNQGLGQARGDYLVLLNNDTVVVRAWLAGLIRHLASHPEWGIIGPVTNWIGNEAQIPVGYGTLDELPGWAARHCRDNDGKHFSIAVLAMFCLAMRRDTFERVGELDERFGVGMFEDDDYACRVREAGLEVVCVEDVFVHHEGKATFRRMEDTAYQRLFAENRQKFEEKWGRPWVPHRYRGAS